MKHRIKQFLEAKWNELKKKLGINKSNQKYSTEIVSEYQTTSGHTIKITRDRRIEPIKKHETYLGKRVHRGLFKSREGKTYNCDINGSLNCIRKVVGDSLFKGKLIERLVVSPVRMKPYKAKS